MLIDLKYAVRSLMKSPGFVVTGILILALCMGASTAIFTVLKKVVLDPLPFAESQRLVAFEDIYPAMGLHHGGQNSVPDYLDRKQMTDVFEAVALWQSTGYEVGASGSPRQIDAEVITPEFLNILKVSPILGRDFTAQDVVQGNDKVAILSHGLWRELFASDRDILGKDIRLSGVSYRIVGIMPPGFSGLFSGPLHSGAKLWVPLAFDPAWTTDKFRHINSWKMVARLQPGVSLEHARQRIDAVNRANLDRVPQLRAMIEKSGFRTLVSSVKDELVGEVRSTLYLLQAAAALVLLIGCVNIASLMLVRSSVRMKELAVRFSLGASRGRLARQLLTESVVLSLAGGVAALAIALVGVKLLASLGARELPRGSEISVDAAILAFNGLIAVAIGIVFGLIPVRHLWREDLARVFHSTERTGTDGRGALRTRSILVASQISLAFILLVGSGLLVFSFARLLQVDPGFRAKGIVTAQVSLPLVRYELDGSTTKAFIEHVIDHLEATPGITHAAITTHLPLSSATQAGVAFINGQPPPPGEKPPAPNWNTVSPGYFKAMSIPLRQGRTIADADEAGKPSVAVIDEFLAHKYWPNDTALGAKISLGPDPNLLTVIGVVGSVKSGSLTEWEQTGQIYTSYKQMPPRQLHFIVRGAASESALFSALRRVVFEFDPELPLTDIKTMSQRLAASLAQPRAAMILCGLFGGLAALLAAVGIYGVLTYSIAQRTREFGIRLALGAQKNGLMNAVLWQGLKIAGIGLTVGAVTALGLTRLIGSLLYKVQPTDPMTFVATGGLLIGIALLACYLPARRVTKLDPIVALRAE